MANTCEYELLAERFVQQYYAMFDSNSKEQLITLYHASAMLTYEDNKTQGHEGIKDILLNKVRFQKIAHAITKLDCQPLDGGGVIVMVSGMLKADEDNPIPYCETFVIKPADGSFFIFHHMFRLSIHNM